MEELPKLPKQYKTWKQFYHALSPVAKAGGFNVICVINEPGTIEEYYIKQIKEGVFREAVADLTEDDFNYEELLLIRHELRGLNVHELRNEIKNSALFKIAKMLNKISDS